MASEALQITPGNPSALADWSTVPSVFRIDAVVDLKRLVRGVRSPQIPTIEVPPRTKDYDALAGNRPEAWARDFEMSGWSFWLAHRDGQRIGAAAVAADSPQIRILADNPTLAILWDLRVAQSARRAGVARALVGAAVQWARIRGRKHLLIETQDNNVGACRLYSALGCRVWQVNPGVYDRLPDEAQILWVLDL